MTNREERNNERSAYEPRNNYVNDDEWNIHNGRSFEGESRMAGIHLVGIFALIFLCC